VIIAAEGVVKTIVGWHSVATPRALAISFEGRSLREVSWQICSCKPTVRAKAPAVPILDAFFGSVPPYNR
jgi:hypothetical protein